MSDSEWLHLLHAAVAASSCAAVARELGVSRTTVSLCLRNKYPGSTCTMKHRVLACYGRIVCPQQSESITRDACTARAAHVPTSSPEALRQWRTCQNCTHNPIGETL